MLGNTVYGILMNILYERSFFVLKYNNEYIKFLLNFKKRIIKRIF